METLYADAALTVNYQAGMIRIALGNMNYEENSQSPINTHTTLVMPLQGFLRVVDSANKLVQQMNEAGVLEKKNE